MDLIKNIIIIWFVADGILLCTNKKYRNQRIEWLISY